MRTLFLDEFLFSYHRLSFSLSTEEADWNRRKISRGVVKVEFFWKDWNVVFDKLEKIYERMKVDRVSEVEILDALILLKVTEKRIFG